ncbi:MAG: polysaccharide deacetylase [Firmicutes bacterium]|nr:polysaccharide deacetylase [Bacillota bacterium]
MSKPMEKEKYFGSVRFFKNMILLVVIVAIAVPSTMAICVTMKVNDAQERTDALTQQVASVQVQLAEAKQKALAMTANSYHDLYPDFYVTPPESNTVAEQNTVYLTFEDGPSERTPEILRILKKQEVKATFFVNGKTDAVSKQRMQAIVADGHTIGMHAYNHNYRKLYASVEAYLEDAYKIFTLIRETTGETPTIFRMPGGSINSYNYQVYQEILAEMLRRGFIPYDWNVFSGDETGNKITVDELTANIVDGSKQYNRAFVMLHDAATKTLTVRGLEPAIVQLKEAGYVFAPLTPEVKPVLFGYKE